jgi:hypothetical protein
MPCSLPDTFDMKPHAPAEYRGPYQSIATTLPGLPICELMPHHARVMDKCTVFRSFSHENSDHWAAAHWMLTGRLGATGSDRAPRQPSMCAVASQLLGPRRTGALAAVNMNDGGFGFHGAAWLGVAHNPFRYGEFSYGNEAGRLPSGDAKSFELSDGLSRDGLTDRALLTRQFRHHLPPIGPLVFAVVVGGVADVECHDPDAARLRAPGRTRGCDQDDDYERAGVHGEGPGASWGGGSGVRSIS